MVSDLSGMLDHKRTERAAIISRHLTPRTHVSNQSARLPYRIELISPQRQRSPFVLPKKTPVPKTLFGPRIQNYRAAVKAVLHHTTPFVPVHRHSRIRMSNIKGTQNESPTCTNLRIRSPSDVRVVFHAVLLELLPMVTRRLDSEERGLIVPGSVYVWEERGAHAEITGVGIERWTDGIRWGPSRVREGFLFYHEKAPSHYVFPGGIYPSHRQHATQDLLIKQTYTAFVDTPRGQRKWHLIAYFTEESLDRLHCIDDYPALSSLNVPHGKYKSARSVKGRPDHIFNPDDSTDSGEFSHLQYVAYDPGSVSSRSTPSPRYPPRSLTWNGAPSDRTDSRRQAEPGPIRGHIRGRSLPESESGILAPLAYLETVTPPRRHPVDETALKAFRAGP